MNTTRTIAAAIAAAATLTTTTTPASACVLEFDGQTYEIADWDPACSYDWDNIEGSNTHTITPIADGYYIEDDQGLIQYGPAAIPDLIANPPRRTFRWPSEVL